MNATKQTWIISEVLDTTTPNASIHPLATRTNFQCCPLVCVDVYLMGGIDKQMNMQKYCATANTWTSMFDLQHA